MAGKGMKKFIAQTARTNAETSKEMLGLAREDLDFSRQQYADSLAELERLRPTLDALAAGQITSTKLANDITKQSWDDYNSTYRPIEQRVAADAMAAGSDAEQEKAAGKAGIDVQRQIDMQRSATDRNLMSMGVNPNSGKFAATSRTSEILGAAARAGAETGAREREKLRGDMMRSSAAAMGRGMTGTALTSIGVGGAAANNAAGMAGAGAAQKNALGQQYLGNRGNVAGLMGNAAGVNADAGNLMNSLYQTTMAAQASQGSSMGSAIGSIAGMGMMMMSSRGVKNTKGRASGKGAREAIDRLPVDRWKYKPGTPYTDAEAGDGPEHVGTYAEDWQRETGMGNGKTINVIDAIGVNMAATKELSRDLKSLRHQLQARGVAA